MARLTVLGIILYGLFLLGLITFNGGLVALTIPLVIYLGAALLTGPAGVQIKVTRTLSSDRVQPDTPIAVHLALSNEGDRLEEVLVEDLLPPALTLIEGQPLALISLAPGETVEMNYTIQGQRGAYSFEGVRVTASDHLGLVRRQTILPLPDSLNILPEVFKPRRVTIRPLRTRAYTGPIPARQGGSGVEFFGVREYQAGDPLRWINWRMTARHPQTLFTNEFQQERIADVGLILDARQRNDVHCRGESLFEHAVRATAALAEAFLNDGNRVGLLTYGAWLDWTFPGYGKVQRQRILDALARARTGESLIFESLDYIPTRFFPAGSQIVLISPLCRDDMPMLVRLRTHGYPLLVVSPDPVTFETQTLPTRPEVALATRIARLERRLLLRKLYQAGIRVVDWRVHDPLGQAIQAALGRLPHWFYAVGWER